MIWKSVSFKKNFISIYVLILHAKYKDGIIFLRNSLFAIIALKKITKNFPHLNQKL